MPLITADEAHAYHEGLRAGKIEVLPSKPCRTQKDLSMAYTPGVADVCRTIAAEPEAAMTLTAKSNLVAVISNGTAVLGLGDIGPLAGKPVMEGKGILFKAFADVDVFDLELDETDPQKLIDIIKALAPGFGGINLEDIKAPECFAVEDGLKEQLDIPVFHDDQHGTAVITGAALINAAHVAGKERKDLKVVVSGAGAGAIACTKFFETLGVQRENIRMFDSKGLLHKGRDNLNAHKMTYACAKDEGDLETVLTGADVFLGLSTKDVLTPAMLKKMADKPIVFACANPDPEIAFDLAKETRPDVIVGTGRSDYPNQINNVLGFPAIFRGALDVQAKSITEGMKAAAAHALADLAREPVPDDVMAAYGVSSLSFGTDYLIPKPFDPRVLSWEASAVAAAAIKDGVARQIIEENAYKASLEERMTLARKRMETLAEMYG